jgi:hypothetical protein
VIQKGQLAELFQADKQLQLKLALEQLTELSNQLSKLVKDKLFLGWL